MNLSYMYYVGYLRFIFDLIILYSSPVSLYRYRRGNILCTVFSIRICEIITRGFRTLAIQITEIDIICFEFSVRSLVSVRRLTI